MLAGNENVGDGRTLMVVAGDKMRFGGGYQGDKRESREKERAERETHG